LGQPAFFFFLFLGAFRWGLFFSSTFFQVMSPHWTFPNTFRFFYSFFPPLGGISFPPTFLSPLVVGRLCLAPRTSNLFSVTFNSSSYIDKTLTLFLALCTVAGNPHLSEQFVLLFRAPSHLLVLFLDFSFPPGVTSLNLFARVVLSQGSPRLWALLLGRLPPLFSFFWTIPVGN